VDEKTLLRLAKTHGTPLVVVDHKVLRENYAQFRKLLPRVQVYYAVKANCAPEIVRTFYEAGASFDVASMAEFLTVHENVKDLPDEPRQAFIWDRIIYKFGALPGEAVDLIAFAHNNKLDVEGLSFHVGSQCTNVQNYVQALHLTANVFAEARTRGFELKLLDIGGGFPAHYDDTVPAFRIVARAINPELDRLFPQPIEILAEPGRFLVASSATAVAKIIGKAVRGGKLCYYVNDGVYQTYSGVIFDHCQYPVKSFKNGPTQICSVFGPTCDALDTISLAEELPDMELGEFVYAQNIGAYSAASSTSFNGFPPAQVVHVNQ
jgi:diaminopimelate decarboxylase